MMLRVALIGTHGISEHEPLSHAQKLKDGAVEFLKSRLNIDCDVSLGYERASTSSALRDLPAPFFRVSGSNASKTPFELDVFEANWSKHTKRNASLFTTLRRIYALICSLDRGYRVTSRKFSIELLILLCASLVFLLCISILLYTFASAVAVIVAHTTVPHRPLVPIGLGFLVILGTSPISMAILRAILRILLGDLRMRAIFFRAAWDDGQNAAPAVERLLTSVSASMMVPGNANKVFSIFGWFSAACIAILCLTISVALMWVFHGQVSATVRSSDFVVLLLGILTGPLLVALLRVVNTLLIPFEDVYAFSHSKARLQNESGSSDAFTSVAERIRAVLLQRDSDDKPLYDSVLIVGHSLGSFVGLQAIELLERAGQHRVILSEDLQRIKAFISYGSAIDKVWSYLRSSCPSKNILGDLPWYRAGDVFCPASEPRDGAIRWANLWYSTDLVGDRVSAVTDCCSNLHALSPLLPWSHSHYLADPAFWQIVLFEAFKSEIGLPSPYADAEIAKSVKVLDLMRSPVKIRWARVTTVLLTLLLAFSLSAVLTTTRHPFLATLALLPPLIPIFFMRDESERINISRLPLIRDRWLKRMLRNVVRKFRAGPCVRRWSPVIRAAALQTKRTVRRRRGLHGQCIGAARNGSMSGFLPISASEMPFVSRRRDATGDHERPGGAFW